MPLKLVVGPANSAKAQVVLDGYRAALSRAPILVVPRTADAAYYRRELAESGVVIGARVESFGGLLREIAQRAAIGAPPIGETAREAVIAASVAATPLRALALAARSPTFAPSLARLVSELEARRVEPARFTSALRAWAGEGSRRREYADELAAVYGAYRRRLDRLGRLDHELHAVRTLDAISLAPDRWGATPVFCYGFDDLEPLQIDTVETLAHRVGAAVLVSLAGERGRVALAGRAGTLETLRPRADEIIELDAQPAFYEDPALHHLERSLFEAPTRAPHGEAVLLLEGGDARAEAELVAAEVASLVDGHFEPGDIAIVTRNGGNGADEIADALDAFAIPNTRTRRDAFGASSVGAGSLALLRCASGEAQSSDLLAWLRVPGVTERPGTVEAFEAWLRRHGITELRPARERWQREHGPIDALAQIERSAREGAVALLDRVEIEIERMLAGPRPRSAALIDPWEAAACAVGRRTLGELRELARVEPRLLGGVAGVIRAFEAAVVEVPMGSDSAAVAITDALSLRARRVRALFICGVQDGVFPAAQSEEAFLGSAERGELARASGLVLTTPVDQLASERYLFYALCSRPTARLAISWHAAGDDGEPALRSLFIEDVRDCFDSSLAGGCRFRAAGALRWPRGERVAMRAARLEQALEEPRKHAASIAPLTLIDDLRALRGRVAHSASGLESWAACPVAWFVERGLRARDLAPDSIWMARGSEAHDVLASVFGGVRAATGAGRLDSSTLPLALELLRGALADSTRALSPVAAFDRAERRRLGLDIERFLTLCAERPSDYEVAAVELGFGVDGDDLPAVEVHEGLALCGRIDRIDVDERGETAIVFDYKTGSSGVSGQSTWDAQRRLQPALYMRITEKLLHVRAVGGLYQPLRDADLRPRGALLKDIALAAPDPPAADRLDGDSLSELIEERIAAALTVAMELEAGALAPRPASCMPRDGGCRYPTICRCTLA